MSPQQPGPAVAEDRVPELLGRMQNDQLRHVNLHQHQCLFDNCGYFEEYLQLIRVVSVVDALVMMALPFVLIVCMNSMIVWKLWKLSDVFDGSTGTRHSPSKTCDGTGETPLSPIPLQSSSQRYTFPQITLVAENERIASRKLDRTASPSSLWKPRAVVPPHVDRSKYEEIDCKTSWKVDGKEKTVDLSPITKDGCRASHGDNHVEDGQVQRNIESRDTSVDSLAMMNKVTQENEDFKGMVVPFGGGKESQSGSKDLPGADHNGSPREVTEDPKKHELSSNLNLEGGDSGEKREGGGKNDKSEKVFIDVNIRVIIDNGHNTSDRGTGSSERETFANSRYAKDTSDNVVEKDGEQDVGIDAMPTRIDNNAKRISSVDVQNNDLRRKEGNTKIGVDLHKPRGLGTIVEQKMRQDKRAVTCVRRKDTSGAKENITKMLLVVSTMFVALQLPSFSLRLDAMWTGRTSPLIREVQRILNDLYYSHIFINFLIYSACGSNFRQCLRQMILSGFLRITRGQRQRRIRNVVHL
ncbi:uncharacterized protein [Palaemon carinicauda]|uniref:uncharacterized protein isoform X3 n=1 Tax=Palaemon carinicauda TaxID=392227 RepID=UPI0035B5FF38